MFPVLQSIFEAQNASNATRLTTSNTTIDTADIWKNPLIFSTYLSLASALLLLLHAIILYGRPLWTSITTGPSASTSDENLGNSESSLSSRIRRQIGVLGGRAVLGWKAIRAVGCLALFTLSVFSLVTDDQATLKWNTGLTGSETIYTGGCITFAYASFLAILSIFSGPRCSRLVSNHLALVLLVSFAVYVYRDLWPLATFVKHPVDISEGWLLWTKIAILGAIGVVVPLFIPRQYVPIDPKKSSVVPNAEQTASLISLLFYSFLDPVVYAAAFSREQMPPLADYDQAHVLVEKSFALLDPFSGAKKGHIFWGLVQIFRDEFIMGAALLIVNTCAGLAGPIGINRLLRFLETNGEGATAKPWVWILWLFVAPIVSSVSLQWYIFVATRAVFQAEAIITQLIFNHSLRIRVKADAPLSSDPVPASEEEAEIPKRTSSSENLIGKINNLVSNDMNIVMAARDFLLPVLYIPLHTVLGVWFLYTILGWSAFAGLFIMLVTLPLPGYITVKIQGVQAEQMKKADARVQAVTETMDVIRMIKLFGWESKTEQNIGELRAEELVWTRKREILNVALKSLNFITPILMMLVTYGTYTLVMRQELTASAVFSSMTVFDILRGQLSLMLRIVPAVVQGKVSLDRISDFLHDTELLDSFADKGLGETNKGPAINNPSNSIDIVLRDAMFSWSANHNTLTATESRRSFLLRIQDELRFKHGRINLVVGPTGSGKTSLLMALLGEMCYVPTTQQSILSLPREGGVAYAAQEPWIQNDTIRGNIIFGAEFDEVRYKKVIDQCALSRDLNLFDAGDQSEVGERGITLSGGQRARISFARAIYSKASILLLDDILAALDVHTAKHIVDNCLSGDLVQGRTVILVTHNLAITRPIAQFVVTLGRDGHVSSQGSLSAMLAEHGPLLAEIKEQEIAIEKADHDQLPDDAGDESKPITGKLVVEEETQEGHVGWSALKLFFGGLGGGHPILFWASFMGGIMLIDLIATVQTWWLGFWARQYEEGHVAVPFYLIIYAVLLAAAAVVYVAANIVYLFGSLRASKSVHQLLIESVLGTTLRWFDRTPVSRVIVRCTQDIGALDGPIAMYFSMVMDTTMYMLVKLIAVLVFTPIWIIPSVLVAVVGAWIGNIYINAQLPVKREMSNARSPVLAHFGAALSGLVSIRAYGAQQAFIQESLTRTDRYTRAARTHENLNRWIMIRIDILSALFTVGLATYLVYGMKGHAQASDAGFSINSAIAFSSSIIWWVRLVNLFEVSGNSLERIRDYVNIEQEPKATVNGKPPAHWPASGDLKVENLSARYSTDGPNVLHNLFFHVKSGERIGVVGRTGSGKSSLTLSLLRAILTEGDIQYDGLPIKSVNLDALRSHITIIPQVPELLAGSLRHNLDPFDQHSDATLNDALRAAGLFSLQGEDITGGRAGANRITLDSSVSAAGANFSVGQRQILALARAIVRGSKLLILDEATSAIDYETDSVIQTSLRNELGKDVTVITIAHRLQTIMDADRIIVLDAGRMVEFDSPAMLLKNSTGALRRLVDESADREKLYDIVESRN